MAGIGFQLSKLAREDGLGGMANAAINGAFFSSGPWLLTAAAVLALQHWAADHLSAAGYATVLTVMAYAFTLSTVIAAPVSIIATRMTADSIFADNRAAVSGIFIATLNWVTVPAVAIAFLFFGVIARVPPLTFLFAMAVVTLLTHLWVASAFLTAVRRHLPILVAYGAGFAIIVAPMLVWPHIDAAWLLATIAAGIAAALTVMCVSIRDEFPSPPELPDRLSGNQRQTMMLALTGAVSALAIWADKWILWFGSESVETVIGLRVNPINDQAGFLGLLTMVPGLTFVLVATETRFSEVFQTLIERCTGTSNYRNIESARQAVSQTILRDMRLLVVGQTVLACLCWVLAPEILRVLGADPRGIFCFRFTAIGAIFHIVATYAALVLSYYDLFGRVLAIWAAFAIVSVVATLASLHVGFASFGWGYMVGAIASACVALTLMTAATGRLTFLLFVGNNPAVVGDARYLV